MLFLASLVGFSGRLKEGGLSSYFYVVNKADSPIRPKQGALIFEKANYG